MITETILKNQGFTKKEVETLKTHFNYIYKLYIANESNIILFLNYINSIQKDVKITFINSWEVKFELLKTNKVITMDLLRTML